MAISRLECLVEIVSFFCCRRYLLIHDRSLYFHDSFLASALCKRHLELCWYLVIVIFQIKITAVVFINQQCKGLKKWVDKIILWQVLLLLTLYRRHIYIIIYYLIFFSNYMQIFVGATFAVFEVLV